METSDIISLASLAVAVWSGIYSWCNGKKLKKQQIQINEYTCRRIEEMKKKKSRLLYVLMLSGRGTMVGG